MTNNQANTEFSKIILKIMIYVRYFWMCILITLLIGYYIKLPNFGVIATYIACSWVFSKIISEAIYAISIHSSINKILIKK